MKTALSFGMLYPVPALCVYIYGIREEHGAGCGKKRKKDRKKIEGVRVPTMTRRIEVEVGQGESGEAGRRVRNGRERKRESAER